MEPGPGLSGRHKLSGPTPTPLVPPALPSGNHGESVRFTDRDKYVPGETECCGSFVVAPPLREMKRQAQDYRGRGGGEKVDGEQQKDKKKKKKKKKKEKKKKKKERKKEKNKLMKKREKNARFPPPLRKDAAAAAAER
ncbi:unnamed protein product [Arctogadus glacialis]